MSDKTGETLGEVIAGAMRQVSDSGAAIAVQRDEWRVRAEGAEIDYDFAIGCGKTLWKELAASLAREKLLRDGLERIVNEDWTGIGAAQVEPKPS